MLHQFPVLLIASCSGWHSGYGASWLWRQAVPNGTYPVDLHDVCSLHLAYTTLLHCCACTSHADGWIFEVPAQTSNWLSFLSSYIFYFLFPFCPLSKLCLSINLCLSYCHLLFILFCYVEEGFALLLVHDVCVDPILSIDTRRIT